MSDEEIRDLLDLGAADYQFGPPIEADETWAAGRRIRTRRSWGVGLGAVAAAALVGVVWTQGLGGGDVAPPPPEPADGTLTGPVPTLTDTESETGTGTTEARGEPFFAQFQRAGTEAPFQLSGASEPATAEDLQGTWNGPHGERLVVQDDQVILTMTNCESVRSSGPVTVEDGELTVDEWESRTADGSDCASADPAMTAWTSALQEAPSVSLDGETLLISGFDGTSDEARVPASLTLGATDEAGFIWEDRESQSEVAPLTLGDDFQLMVSGDGDESGLTSIADLNLESPQMCGQVMTSSLRSDGVLLAGAAAPWPVCSEGEDALPPAEPPRAVVALLQSGPTVTFEDGVMVITGTVPESLLEQDLEFVPDDTTATTEPPTPPDEETEDPPASDAAPGPTGPSALVVMSEGSWEPSGELSPLTDGLAVDRRWLPVSTDSQPPEVGADPSGDRGLSFDGTTWRIRDCGVDISVDGAIENGRLLARGEPDVVPDPDPGAACVFSLTPEDWVSILTGEPLLRTDGEILVVQGEVEDADQVPVGMAFLPDGASDPSVGPVSSVTPEDLAAGLTETPAADIGVSDIRDPQPDHDTALSVQDGMVTVDVGCDEPLRGPAWFSQVGPEEFTWQLTAALSIEPDCADAAKEDALLWQQMLAEGVFLHHSGDYVILDSMAEPAPAG